MDFESPDVEREFPGLYASESGSGKRSQESDFSDDAHERSTKKDILIGKRKEKKESKKDQGYAALEGESSPEEDVDIKSPCKSKKSKSFKFPSIKEKREKSREKEAKEKEKDKDRERDKDSDKDRDKEKKKESKSKLKLKDKKKMKSGDDSTESIEELPVFGVPLSVAVNRSHCHDGIGIPQVVRDCIDYVQDCGLNVEGIYKVSGVKSKVQLLRRSYNKREFVKLSDYDIPTVTSLLKLFLRELPDPLFTVDLISKFEDVASMKELGAREQELSALLAALPTCHLTCISWIMRHLENVVANESHNKMSINNVGTVFGPVFQTSPRVVSALLTHSHSLFFNIKLIRYVPPLSPGCTSLPSSKEAIAAELAKQESLLNQIHMEMNHGYTVREDQLWEVQRFITLLKRKVRSLEKAQEVVNQASEKQQVKIEHPVPAVSSSVTKVPTISPSCEKLDFQLQVPPDDNVKSGTGAEAEDLSVKNKPRCWDQTCSKDEVDSFPASKTEASVVSASESFNPDCNNTAPPSTVPNQVDFTPPSSNINEGDERVYEVQLHLEHAELLKLQNYFMSRISHEREEIKALFVELKSLLAVLPEASISDAGKRKSVTKTQLENIEIATDEATSQDIKLRSELLEQNALLLQDRLNLVKKIMLEQEACISLRVQLNNL